MLWSFVLPAVFIGVLAQAGKGRTGAAWAFMTVVFVGLLWVLIAMVAAVDLSGDLQRQLHQLAVTVGTDREGAEAFLAAVLVLPLMLLVVLTLPSRKPQHAGGDADLPVPATPAGCCINCGKSVGADVDRCPYCGAIQYGATPVPAADKTCPKCAEAVKAAALVCRYCGHAFDSDAGAAS